MPIGQGEKKKPPRHGFACHPSCRGELTSYSPRRGMPIGQGGKEHTSPLLNLPCHFVEIHHFLIPLGEGCPLGGVGENNTPHKSEFVTPLVGELTSYSPQRGVPIGRGGKYNSSQCGVGVNAFRV